MATFPEVGARGPDPPSAGTQGSEGTGMSPGAGSACRQWGDKFCQQKCVNQCFYLLKYKASL